MSDHEIEIAEKNREIEILEKALLESVNENCALRAFVNAVTSGEFRPLEEDKCHYFNVVTTEGGVFESLTIHQSPETISIEEFAYGATNSVTIPRNSYDILHKKKKLFICDFNHHVENRWKFVPSEVDDFTSDNGKLHRVDRVHSLIRETYQNGDWFIVVRENTKNETDK